MVNYTWSFGAKLGVPTTWLWVHEANIEQPLCPEVAFE